MGFLGQAESRSVRTTVLTARFQIQCTLEIFGSVQVYVNDDQKHIFDLHDATLYGVEVGNPARSMRVPTMHVRKDEVHALVFDETLSREDALLMPRPEHVTAYTSHYAVDATFYMGQDAYISDFIENFKSMFLPLTDVHIFPLFQAQAAIVQQAPSGFVSRTTIQMHHSI
jgi:hypothetical protein